jgi:hypothetical protein
MLQLLCNGAIFIRRQCPQERQELVLDGHRSSETVVEGPHQRLYSFWKDGRSITLLRGDETSFRLPEARAMSENDLASRHRHVVMFQEGREVVAGQPHLRPRGHRSLKPSDGRVIC